MLCISKSCSRKGTTSAAIAPQPIAQAAPLTLLAPKLGEAAQNSLHTMEDPCSLAAMWSCPCWLPRGYQSCSSPMLSPLWPGRSRTLQRKSRAQPPWGQPHCDISGWQPPNCWDAACYHPPHFILLFNSHQAATIFNWYWFELVSESGNLYIPLAVPRAGETPWSPYLILRFAIQANPSNWVQPSSPDAVFGPSKGRSSSMFTPYAPSTTSKYNHTFLCRKKMKEPNPHFQHLMDLLLSFKSSLMAVAPTTSSRKFSRLRSKSHTLCSRRGTARRRAAADTACLPLPATGEHRVLKPCPGVCT